MKLISNKIRLILLVSLFLFSGCPKVIKIFPNDKFTKEARSKFDVTYTEMERNRQLWKESKIENYDFEIAYNTGAGTSLFTGGAIKVREGNMISIEKISKDSSGEIYESENVQTIDKLFEYMKQELGDYKLVEAKYNEKSGYPERIKITHSYAIDNYGVFDLMNFEIVK